MPRCFQADSQVDPWGFHRLQEHLWEALTSQTLVTPLIQDRGRTLGTGLSAKVPGHRAHLRCHPLFMLTLHFCRVLDTPSVAAFEDMYGSKHVSKKFGNKGRIRGEFARNGSEPVSARSPWQDALGRFIMFRSLRPLFPMKELRV